MTLAAWADRYKAKHRPSFVIGEPERPYLLRWYLIPRNPIFNVYLHEIRRSDDDRALHDHPWINLTIMVAGSYVEHSIDAGGINRRVLRGPGRRFKLRWPSAAHRLDVDHPVTTLFITGPRWRSWGFHCPDAGWVDWKRFTASGDKGRIGKGCNQ